MGIITFALNRRESFLEPSNPFSEFAVLPNQRHEPFVAQLLKIAAAGRDRGRERLVPILSRLGSVSCLGSVCRKQDKPLGSDLLSWEFSPPNLLTDTVGCDPEPGRGRAHVVSDLSRLIHVRSIRRDGVVFAPGAQRAGP